jgi:hypothetical protein
VRVLEVGAHYEVRLVNLSAGGFLASTPAPYPIDTERDFVFLAREDAAWRAPLQAKTVYSHARAGGVSVWPQYMTGFAFLNTGSQPVASRIDDLLTHATTALKFV